MQTSQRIGYHHLHIAEGASGFEIVALLDQHSFSDVCQLSMPLALHLQEEVEGLGTMQGLAWLPTSSCQWSCRKRARPMMCQVSLVDFQNTCNLSVACVRHAACDISCNICCHQSHSNAFQFQIRTCICRSLNWGASEPCKQRHLYGRADGDDDDEERWLWPVKTSKSTIMSYIIDMNCKSRCI